MGIGAYNDYNWDPLLSRCIRERANAYVIGVTSGRLTVFNGRRIVRGLSS